MPLSTVEIREYIKSAYSDEELVTLCSDYFRDVYDNFASGMTKAGKIQLLLDHCQRRDLISNLLAALERDRPAQYRTRFGQVMIEPGSVSAPPIRDPRQVFISHAYEDAEFAHRLAADLRARGLRAWIAPDSIRPGEMWVEAIERGLEESGVFVLVLTPFAVSSNWVKTETRAAIGLAHKSKVRFIPAQVESCDAPPLWEAFQGVPFAGRYETGLAALLGALGGAGDQPSPLAEEQRSPAPAPRVQAKEQPAKWEDAGIVAPAPASRKAAPAIAGPAEPSPAVLTITSPLSMEFVRVPAGEFLMGSDPKVDKDALDFELPQHRLSLPEFYIGKYPVTNAQYAVFVGATKRSAPDHWKKGAFPSGKEQHPVVGVSWHDALAFCRWLSKAAGQLFRLPTEAEWEKAARGVDGCIYPWGNDPPDDRRCNFGGKVGDTTPVDKYPAGASPCGALDMAGNVWEWTGSLWGRDSLKSGFGYPYTPTDGREDVSAPDAMRRVLRGGAFDGYARSVRCAFRSGFDPYNRYWRLGFRVVASPRNS